MATTHYINIFVNHYIKTYRRYSQEKLYIKIDGLRPFVDKGRNDFLLEELRDNGFYIELSGDKDIMEELRVSFSNAPEKAENTFIINTLGGGTSLVEVASKAQVSLSEMLIMKTVAQVICRRKILYKAIVFDLDETLWKGTLSEECIDGIIKNQQSIGGIPFISFMRFIRMLTDEFGIFVAVCSRNNSTIVTNAINELSEELFPLKGQIDCLIANDNDKSLNLQHIAKYLSILPEAMIFIDDNKIVRDEVRRSLPDVFVPEWENHEDLITTLVSGCFLDRKNISLKSRKRRRNFHIIKAIQERNDRPPLSARTFNDAGHGNALALFAASNQFNFSQINRGFPDGSISTGFELYLDINGEDLGVCSAITYSKTSEMMTIYNWAMSCRFFEIGVEEMVLLYIKKAAGDLPVRINFCDSGKNQRVKMLLEKYQKLFSVDIENGYIDVLYTPKHMEELKDNTNITLR